MRSSAVRAMFTFLASIQGLDIAVYLDPLLVVYNLRQKVLKKKLIY